MGPLIIFVVVIAPVLIGTFLILSVIILMKKKFVFPTLNSMRLVRLCVIQFFLLELLTSAHAEFNFDKFSSTNFLAPTILGIPTLFVTFVISLFFSGWMILKYYRNMNGSPKLWNKMLDTLFVLFSLFFTMSIFVEFVGW